MAFPWDFHPDLMAGRLVAVANLIATGRDAAVLRHDPSIGDDDWVLGCRAFQACRFAISTGAKSEAAPWLSVMDPSRHFLFRIGSIPLRFYRGDPEDPTHRTKSQSFPELAQLSMVFPGDDLRDVVARLAVETDLDGRAMSIHCVGTRGDNVVFNWSIPFDAAIVPAAFDQPLGEGVDLPPPLVAELEPEDAENDNAGSTRADAANS